MKYLLCFLSVLAFQTSALGGTGSSGGGGAFVCRDARGEIQSVELVDLWEAKVIDGLTIAYSGADPIAQARKAIDRLQDFDTGFHKRALLNLQLMTERMHDLPPGVGMNPPPDMAVGYQKPGCPLEGMLFWDGLRERLVVARPLFSALISKTDVAAAYAHEALYKTMRELRVPHLTSLQARGLVGCLFSTDRNCLKPVKAEVRVPKDAEAQLCRTETSEYYYWESETSLNYLFTRILDSRFPGGAFGSQSTPDHHDRNSSVPTELNVDGFEKFGIGGASFVGQRGWSTRISNHFIENTHMATSHCEPIPSVR